MTGDSVGGTTTGGFPTGTATDGPLGTGPITLSDGTTLRTDGTRAIRNPLTLYGATVDVPVGATLTTTGNTAKGSTNSTVTVTKSGLGTWRVAGTSSFDGQLIINAGRVLLHDVGTKGGDLNAKSISAQNGGTFQFGQGTDPTVEDPDLSNACYVGVSNGGTALWNLSEDFGSLGVGSGGSVVLRGDLTLSSAFNLGGGTVAAAAGSLPQITGGAKVRTFGAGGIFGAGGTSTLDGVRLATTGGVDIPEGVLATNAAVPPTGTITFGTPAGYSPITAGTLSLAAKPAATPAPVGPVVILLGGGILELGANNAVSTPSLNILNNASITKKGFGLLNVTGALTVGTGGTFKLTNTDAAGANVRTTVGTLVNNGKVDVGGSGVVVNTADPAAIRAQIVAGRNGGDWLGATGITSSAAAADPTNRAVGYVVTGAAATVAYTVAGDANLDGRVNISDRGAYLANNGLTSGATWQQADFNYDGRVNIQDRGIYLSHNGQALGGTPSLTAGARGLRTAALTATGPAALAALAAPAPAVLEAGQAGDTIPDIFYNPATGALSISTDLQTAVNAFQINLSTAKAAGAVAFTDGVKGLTWSTFNAGGQEWDSPSVSAAGDLTPGTYPLGTLAANLTPADFRSGGSNYPGGAQVLVLLSSLTNNEVYTTVTFVPEPATAGVLGLAAAAGLLGRRRRGTSR